MPNQLLTSWKETKASFPINLRQYTEPEQVKREQNFEQFSEYLKQKTKKSKGSLEAIRKEKADLIDSMANFYRNTLDYSEDQIQTILSEQMVKSTWSFLKAAKKYDAALNFEDAFQALRNVWILNGLQLLMGKKVELTASIFAYSMLYPYTDNYLDDATISVGEKLAFGVRFASRLEGENVEPQSLQEEKIFEMVQLIEGEWSRDLFPELYKSLLDIHGAQSDSVRLIAGLENLAFEERLAICIHKGGTSVVADGYLLAGTLSAEQESFLYTYGAYLQLLDDFQDLSDDLNEDVLTAFAYAAKTQQLDSILNRTFHLGQLVIQQAEAMESDEVPVFQSLMQKSIELFLVEAVQANSPYFSPSYVAAFSNFSPLSFSYIEKKSGTFSPYQNQLFEKLIQQALDSNEDEEFPFLQKKSLLKQQA
ncbi:hypothetical protein [Mangrovibacterium lignilyticum]|uniref:hypothetical protein n=1 Tax=Mangrovibacterium lignilyticum TaxID=2668052 RepID=UPI0013D3CC40|nr:hypothetical protein [Mangrovibacterium lignilyticum]